MKKIMDNWENKMNSKTVIVIFIIILLLQVIARVSIGNQKEYFHMDEMYSYGLMNYDKININDNKDFYNTWHVKEYYKDYIQINSNEVWDFSPVYENQKNDVHPPFFYLLLRIASTFTVDNFSKWSGIGLNIVIFMASSVLIYLISKRIFVSKTIALFMCALNGFTFMALESSIYIRMYELANFNILLLAYTQLRILGEEKLKWTNLIPIVIALLLGGLTHYYFFIYALTLYVMYTVKCVKEKNYKNLIKYNIAMGIAAVTFLLIFPQAINHVFFGYRGLSAGNETGYFLKIGKFLEEIAKNLGGYFLVLVPLILYIITIKKEKKYIEKEQSNIEWIFIPLMVYFLGVAKNAPYLELRYMLPIYSVITISVMYFIWRCIKQYFDREMALRFTAVLCILIVITPFVEGMKLDFTYLKFNRIGERVAEKNLPIIYVLNTDKNRFLDDLYLFTLVDKSIVIDSKDLQKFEKEIDAQKHYIFICNDDEIKEKFLKNKKNVYLQHMNACDIWEIY